MSTARTAPDYRRFAGRRIRVQHTVVHDAARARADLNLCHTASGIRVGISGELDLTTAPELTAFLSWLESSPRHIVIDLSGVRFADCSGIAPLLESGRRRAMTHQPSLTLVNVSRPVHRLLTLLATDIDAST